MDINSIPKGLFNLKNVIDGQETEEVKPERFTAIPDHGNSLLHNDNTTIQRFGFNSAGNTNGSAIGLSICLNRIYQDHRNEVARDAAKQAAYKHPYRQKLLELKADSQSLKERNAKITSEEIPLLTDKIERLKKSIIEIRTNPELVSSDSSGKASFYIGLFILLFLTVYLFIFYSCASYSSFFKEFQISEIGLANSIFDPKALSKAINDGLTELILITTIPAVFLGLGYLIHKSSEKKGLNKYLFISSLIFVTFIFDVIIAYEICEKIYDLQKANSFETGIPEYSLRLAFQSVNFWLIIFAGFVVYLIWGLVFNFTIEAYEQLDKLKVAIRNKQDEIKKFDQNIEKLNEEININKNKESKNTSDISKLNDIVDHNIIIPKEFKHYLFQFMQGWSHWMSANLKNQTQQQECQNVLNLFIAANVDHSILNN
jgi:hypothetical protein